MAKRQQLKQLLITKFRNKYLTQQALEAMEDRRRGEAAFMAFLVNEIEQLFKKTNFQEKDLIETDERVEGYFSQQRKKAAETKTGEIS